MICQTEAPSTLRAIDVAQSRVHQSWVLFTNIPYPVLPPLFLSVLSTPPFFSNGRRTINFPHLWTPSSLGPGVSIQSVKLKVRDRQNQSSVDWTVHREAKPVASSGLAAMWHSGIGSFFLLRSFPSRMWALARKTWSFGSIPAVSSSESVCRAKYLYDWVHEMYGT